MQTFLPYPSFEDSAACLDYKRLGKQRLETLQIVHTLLEPKTTKGWLNHPAVRMWRGYEFCLVNYGLIICEQWQSRGYKDNIWFDLDEYYTFLYNEDMQVPPWLGNDAFHKSHQSNLLRKNPEHYEQFNWDVERDLPYVWPV